MTNRTTRTLAVFTAVAALGIGGGVPAAMARHGADDPAGHDAGDDHGDRGAHELRHRGRAHEVRHRHRHHHHGHHHRRHNDDGPNR